MSELQIFANKNYNKKGRIVGTALWELCIYLSRFSVNFYSDLIIIEYFEWSKYF